MSHTMIPKDLLPLIGAYVKPDIYVFKMHDYGSHTYVGELHNVTDALYIGATSIEDVYKYLQKDRIIIQRLILYISWYNPDDELLKPYYIDYESVYVTYHDFWAYKYYKPMSVDVIESILKFMPHRDMRFLEKLNVKFV